MATFKTTLQRYCFPSSAHPGYAAMVRQIEANADGRGRWMHARGGKDDTAPRFVGVTVGVESEAVELEAAHLFGNQWNEADREGVMGRRLFDWYDFADFNGPYKRGHWLEITPEMAEARRVTLSCGYCGRQYGPHHEARPAGEFCTACLDSEYLTPENFPSLRLASVADREHKDDRPPLTDAERAELMPRYIERQTTGDDSRAKKKRDKQRADVLAKYAKESGAATAERDGMLWLWDRGLSLDNVIYYSHTGKFSFGWRSPIAPEVADALRAKLDGFPFAVEYKTTARAAA